MIEAESELSEAHAGLFMECSGCRNERCPHHGELNDAVERLRPE